jgi:hypothetical protein
MMLGVHGWMTTDCKKTLHEKNVEQKSILITVGFVRVMMQLQRKA